MVAHQVHILEDEGSNPSPAIMTENLEEKIADSASGPAKVSSDGISVEQHPLADQIAADKYLASKTATQKKGIGIKFSKLSPPGAE